MLFPKMIPAVPMPQLGIARSYFGKYSTTKCHCHNQEKMYWGIMWWPYPLTFGHQIFRNPKLCPNKFTWVTKVSTCYLKMELWLQNWNFAHNWSCGDLDMWCLDLKFWKLLNTDPESLFMDKSCCLIYLSEVMAPKLNFWQYLVLWWPWPCHIIVYTSIKYLWIPFMHSRVFTLTRLVQMEGQTHRLITRKYKASRPQKWVRHKNVIIVFFLSFITGHSVTSGAHSNMKCAFQNFLLVW